jgi:hypothetical protein
MISKEGVYQSLKKIKIFIDFVFNVKMFLNPIRYLYVKTYVQMAIWAFVITSKKEMSNVLMF